MRLIKVGAFAAILFLASAGTLVGIALSADRNQLTVNPKPGKPAVCTSTDGKQTCRCGDKACVAQQTTCFCFVASDPPRD
jgi:hypothetical protein